MKKKKSNPHHPYKPLILLLTVLLASAPASPVYAFRLPDVVKDYIDIGSDGDTEESVEDKDQNVESGGENTGSSGEKGDTSGEFSVIEKAIVEIMKSDWYKNTDARGRKEKIAEILAATGYVDKDTAMKGIDTILNFEFYGQKIGVLLDDYTEELYEQEEGESYEQRDEITESLDQDRQALILYGLGFQEFDYALDYSSAKWNLNGLKTSMNDACTVADFKTDLKGKDLIVIEEHGCTYEDEPLIATEEEYDPLSSYEYQDDLDAGRLEVMISEDGAQYCLKPSFFEYYYGGGQLENSFVWIGSCYGASNSRLMDAFVNTGARAVVGHSDSVYTMYDYNMLNTVVDGMISGESSSEAFQKAKDQWGENDEQFAIKYMAVDYKEIPASYPSLTGDVSWK